VVRRDDWPPTYDSDLKKITGKVWILRESNPRRTPAKHNPSPLWMVLGSPQTLSWLVCGPNVDRGLSNNENRLKQSRAYEELAEMNGQGGLKKSDVYGDGSGGSRTPAVH
jgi:hypothetical protein